MLGAIIGDVIGSVYEWDNIKTKDFPLITDTNFYTDDTVCTVALADCLLQYDGNPTLYLQWYCRKYEGRGYGSMFSRWVDSDSPKPYDSFGNGAAMRISSVAHLLNDWETIRKVTQKYTSVTHNHPLGIDGAMAVSESIYEGKSTKDKSILNYILTKYYPKFDLNQTLDSIRPTYEFNETCQETVPQAIMCVIESTSFEDAIRNAISLGGDSDTLACITGSIAEAFYPIPLSLQFKVMSILPDEFNEIIFNFYAKL